MRLATRCSSCGTIFRVVQDQLRVSEGWVRCGRCAEIFDAGKQLFDPDRESPPAWSPAIPAALLMPAAVEPQVDELPPPLLAQESSAILETEATAEASTTPDDLVAADWPAEPESRQEPHWSDTTSNYSEPLPGSIEAGISATAAVVQSDSPQPLPAFMRSPAGGRWRRPGVQASLSLLALLLFLMLCAQAIDHFHDAIAAKYPSTRQALRALCEIRACELQPWRRIEALSVESSSLSKAAAGNQYLLALTLHNKSDIAVAIPSIELSLTDQAGALLARRMLAPTDFEAGAPLIAANADLPLTKLLSTGEQSVAGYSIEIFNR
jgi:predicted Zn finger-like uncharacterized protein